MIKKTIATPGQLQMVFGAETVEIATASTCPICRQTITEAQPCEYTLGTTVHMFDQGLLFHSQRTRRRKAPPAAPGQAA